ncbi:MAG: hypothetical protein CM1200mP20_03710 [Pseudomonadota bacterium]|nr:MAG: hypothetical protein CM1200mP20_03710 [Pseudomonadota bacterium]
MTPHNPFLAERNRDGQWVRLCYSEAADRADRISQALLDRGLSLQRPVMVLSGNSIEHALLSLGAMQVGIPVVPVSPAYSLLSSDHQRLKTLFELCSPGLVYVSDHDQFARALAALPLADTEVVAGDRSGTAPGATPFSDLLASRRQQP